CPNHPNTRTLWKRDGSNNYGRFKVCNTNNRATHLCDH
ncbi:unnamed protein product, partial [Heterotrigona itama]